MSGAAASPRNLVLRNGTQAQKSVTPVDLEPKPDIGEGNQRLHSFYRPGLVAGTYNIDVEQDIAKYSPSPGERFADIPAQDKLDSKKSSKSFTVIAPVFPPPRFPEHVISSPRTSNTSHHPSACGLERSPAALGEGRQ